MQQLNDTSKLETLNIKLSYSNDCVLQKIERRFKTSDTIKSPLIKHTITTKKISKIELEPM